MNISIEIDESKTDEAKQKLIRLLHWLHSLEIKACAISPDAMSFDDQKRIMVFESEQALEFLAEAMAKIEREKIPYTFRVCDVEGADVWKRSF